MGFERVRISDSWKIMRQHCANQAASFEFLTLKQGHRRGMQGGTFTPRRTYCTCYTYVLCCYCGEYIYIIHGFPPEALSRWCVCRRKGTTERVQPLFRSISYMHVQERGVSFFLKNRHPCCERAGMRERAEQRIPHPHTGAAAETHACIQSIATRVLKIAPHSLRWFRIWIRNNVPYWLCKKSRYL